MRFTWEQRSIRFRLLSFYFNKLSPNHGRNFGLNDTQGEYLNIAKESCDQITLGLNDLLDVARLDTGKLHVEPCPLAIGPIVQRVVTSMTPMAEETQIRLRHHIRSGLSEVMLDTRRIIQVLTNLLRNALKFTAAGGEVAVDVTAAPPGYDGVLVAVRDTGRGIAPEQCRYIFDRLYQARSEASAFEGGLGLGLYICREIIELHRGEIWVESIPGKGSAFFFTLPYTGVHTTPEGVSEEVSA